MNGGFGLVSVDDLELGPVTTTISSGLLTAFAGRLFLVTLEIGGCIGSWSALDLWQRSRYIHGTKIHYLPLYDAVDMCGTLSRVSRHRPFRILCKADM